MTVKEITLLSTEEYEKYEPIISAIDDWWWLRSPGYAQDTDADVLYDGSVYGYGSIVYNISGAVRPALKLDLDTSDNLSKNEQKNLVGTKIEYGNCQWTVLDANSNEVYALCDEIIAKRQFDAKTNVWEESELKGWLETEGLRLITNAIDKKPLENEVCEAFKEYIQNSNVPNLEAIKQHISEEKPISAFSFPSTMYEDVAKTFAENDIPYSAFSDTTPQADQQGTCLLFVRDSDGEKVKAVFEELIPTKDNSESLDELIENIDTNNSMNVSEPLNPETVDPELS